MVRHTIGGSSGGSKRMSKQGASQTGSAFHSTGAKKCQEGAIFFGRGASYTLDSAHIILTGATAGSERAPRGFMLSTYAIRFHYHLLLRRRFMWGAVAWVVDIGSAKAHLICSVVRCPAADGAGHRTAEKAPLCRGWGGGRPALPCIRACGIRDRRLWDRRRHSIHFQ